jgi:hypothetical protein
MPKFEVQENTICDGWTNTWHEWDDDNNEIPLVFDSYGEAMEELQGNIYDMHKAFNMGDISIKEDIANFRIVEVVCLK